MTSLLEVDSSFINTTVRDEDNWTPHNKLSMVQLFVNHGVDVSLLSVCDEYGDNVFHWCARHYSRKETLSLLLPLADTNTINKCDNRNQTPLYHASYCGRLENVRLLLSTDIVDVDIGPSAYDEACGYPYSNKDNKDEIQRLIRDYKK